MAIFSGTVDIIRTVPPDSVFDPESESRLVFGLMVIQQTSLPAAMV